ncbi:MAG: response regulator transcription factor, partial [Desulfobacterales bacterium]|nr:response regulator transcription factor [Desulfobacterales bacterium]
MDNFTIMLADDHAMFRKGIRRLIDSRKGMKVVGEANDREGLLRALQKQVPDMVILDISMPDSSGMAGGAGLVLLREVKEMHPAILVLMLTMHTDLEYLNVALDSGASGYLLKEDSDIELFDAISRIREGGEYVTQRLARKQSAYLKDVQNGKVRPTKDELSLRESQVLKQIGEGMTNREIANFLNISV